VSAAQGRAFSKQAFLSSYLPALTLALGTGVAVPAVPSLAKSFGVSFGVASGVVTAFLLGNLAGTLPSGWLIDRLGRRSVLIAGPIVTSVVAIVTGFATSFPELIVLRFVNGVSAQMWLMARLAAISQTSPPEERGRHVSWMFGMDNTGKLTGPLVGAVLVSLWGLRAPFIAYGILALVALVPAFLFAEETHRPPVGTAVSSPRPKLALRALLLPRWPYFGIALFAGLTRGPVSADLLHLYAAFRYHLGAAQIGYLATGAAALSVPLNFVSGSLMDRFGRKNSMIPAFTGVAVSMVLLSVSAFARLSFAWYVVLFIACVAAQALTAGSIQTVGADVAPAEGRGVFLGFWRFTGLTGSTVSPTIFAVLAAQISYGASFLFNAMTAVVVAVLIIRYVPKNYPGAPMPSAEAVGSGPG
jgi:MFS family permease